MKDLMSNFIQGLSEEYPSGKINSTKRKQYALSLRGASLLFYETKDNKIVIDLDADSIRLRDSLIEKLCSISDSRDITLRMMCAPADHLNKTSFYPELKKFQAFLSKFGFTQDNSSWSFMTRVPANVEIKEPFVEKSSDNAYFDYGYKDSKIDGVQALETFKTLDAKDAAYAFVIVPQRMDDWFHGRLMNKRMKDADLQLEQEIIEAMMFIKHHFSIPDKYPKVIYRVTVLAGVKDIESVRKVKSALRPIQSWTKSEKSAKKFFKDFFEKMGRDTDNVACLYLKKQKYTKHVLIDRDQIETFLKLIHSFVVANKGAEKLPSFIENLAMPLTRELKFFKKVNAKNPVESYLKSLSECSKFLMSPYIKGQQEIVLNVPRGVLLEVDDCVAAEDI